MHGETKRRRTPRCSQNPCPWPRSSPGPFPHPGDARSSRRIGHFTLIPFPARQDLGNATDFSPASSKARIESGYNEARERWIEEYHDVARP